MSYWLQPSLGLFCALYLCVVYVHVGRGACVHEHVCGGQRFLSLNLELALWARMTGQQSTGIYLSQPVPNTKAPDIHCHTWLCNLLGIQTQVSMFVQQALYLLNPLPGSCILTNPKFVVLGHVL